MITPRRGGEWTRGEAEGGRETADSSKSCFWGSSSISPPSPEGWEFRDEQDRVPAPQEFTERPDAQERAGWLLLVLRRGVTEGKKLRVVKGRGPDEWNWLWVLRARWEG